MWTQGIQVGSSNRVPVRMEKLLRGGGQSCKGSRKKDRCGHQRTPGASMRGRKKSVGHTYKCWGGSQLPQNPRVNAMPTYTGGSGSGGVMSGDGEDLGGVGGDILYCQLEHLQRGGGGGGAGKIEKKRNSFIKGKTRG